MVKNVVKNGVKVVENFTYRSDNNVEWMTQDELLKWINANRHHIGKI